MPKKQVFLLYNNQSEKDLVIAKNLSVFFSVFHKIELRDTLAGDGDDEIMQDILTSDMLVPLVSADFFTVDKNEDLTAEAVKKGTSVIPILSRDCLWQMSPTIKALVQNILPKGKPLYEYDEKSIDSAFTKVVKKLAEKITGKVSQPVLVRTKEWNSKHRGLYDAADEIIIQSMLEPIDLKGEFTKQASLVMMAIMWTIVFPFAPLVIMLIVEFRMKSDFVRLTKFARRPIPVKRNDSDATGGTLAPPTVAHATKSATVLT